MSKLYVYQGRPSRGFPCLTGFLAFICTACLLLVALLVGVPAKAFEALHLTPPSILGMAPATETPTPEPTDDPDATATARAKPRPTNTRIPTKTPNPTPSLRPSPTPIRVAEHFLLGRPVDANAMSMIPAWTYLYGDTEKNSRDVHHGEEFVNPIGTPLYAVADGTVVVAGGDDAPHCGAQGQSLCGPTTNFYGKLVVLRLDQAFGNQVVFVLYGHMRGIAVQVGQHVRKGEQVGTVGDSGVAVGPHVHFEVRLGVNDYGHTRNPILWMRPLSGYGAIAGAVRNSQGTLVRGIPVTLYKDNETQDYVMDTETYGRDPDASILPVNSDDAYKENWAMGDLHAGNYIVGATVNGQTYLRHVQIQDGHLTFIVFGGP